MGFLSEPPPPRGAALDVLPGIRRVVADNPSVMTYHGTNTYLIEDESGLVVIDPGPDDPAHVRDILAAANGTPVALILLTHAHKDHYGALNMLRQATSAKVAAYEAPGNPGIEPDIKLADGARIGGFTAVYTPGHAPDHLCFQYYGEDGEKILFSGDHVMSWSSSIVSPPDGDMSDYYRSLERLLERDDDLFLSGHGPLLREPRLLTAALLANRQMRERAILTAMKAQRTASVASLAARLYHKLDPKLKIAAQRNVLAHLLKLEKEGIVTELEPEAELPPDDPAALMAPDDEKKPENPDLVISKKDARRRFGLAGLG